MLKYLVLPILLLSTLAPKAQLKGGIAADYLHIKAPSYLDMGSGHGWGASAFFRYPVSKTRRWELDWSADFTTGHTGISYSYLPPWPLAGFPRYTVHENRSFLYLGIPVHLVYSLPLRNGRVFAGPGVGWSYLKQDASLEDFDNPTRTSMIAASARAGIQIRQIVLSGEFRPWTYLFNKPDTYVHYTNPDNMLMVKLGYEFGGN